MFDYLKLSPGAFGLNISDSCLKIAQLEKRGKYFSLNCFGNFAIKPGIIEKGEIKNKKALIALIEQAIPNVRPKKINTKNVIVSLPEEESFLKVIKMPLMKKQELAEAIKYEAENYIPMPIEKVYLDFQIVDPVYDHKNYLEILIAALPKKTVDPYLEVLKKSELKPLALEIEAQAIARVLIKNQVSPVPILIIDIGPARTSFIIFSGHSLRFTCCIPVLHQALVKRKKLALANLIEQIKKHLSYYQTHASWAHLPPDGKTIKKILVCGDGANIKGLIDILSKELKTLTEIANPWINILPAKVKNTPELSFKQSLKYTTALGLALRGATNSY